MTSRVKICIGNTMRTYKRKGIRKIKKHTKNKNIIYNRKSIRKIKKYTRKYLKNKKRGGSAVEDEVEEKTEGDEEKETEVEEEEEDNEHEELLTLKPILSTGSFNYNTEELNKKLETIKEGGGKGQPTSKKTEETRSKKKTVAKNENVDPPHPYFSNTIPMEPSLITRTTSSVLPLVDPGITAVRREAEVTLERIKHNGYFPEFEQSINSMGIVLSILQMASRKKCYDIESYGLSAGVNPIPGLFVAPGILFKSQGYNSIDGECSLTLGPEFSLGSLMVARFFNFWNYVPNNTNKGVAAGFVKGISHLKPLSAAIGSNPLSPFFSGQKSVWAHMVNEKLGGGRGLHGYLDGRVSTGNANTRWLKSVESLLKGLLGGTHNSKTSLKTCIGNEGGVIIKLGVIYACIASTLPYNRVRAMIDLPPLDPNGAFHPFLLDGYGGLSPAFRCKFQLVKLYPDHRMVPISIDEAMALFQIVNDYEDTFRSFEGDPIVFEQFLNPGPLPPPAAAPPPAASAGAD